MDFGPLFVTAGIAQAVHESAGLWRLSCSRASADTRPATGVIFAPRCALNAEAAQDGRPDMGAYTTSKAGRSGHHRGGDDNGRRSATTVLFPDEY